MADSGDAPIEAAAGTPSKKIGLADLSKDDLIKKMALLMQKVKKVEEGPGS